MADLYSEHGCGGVIDLGDTTDDRSAIPLPTLDTVLGHMLQYQGTNFKLIGNHEQYTRDAKRHPGAIYESAYTVVDKVKMYNLPDTDAIGVFVAYPGDYAALNKTLLSIKEKYAKSRLVLFGHFQTVGCQLNSGIAHEGVPKSLLSCYEAGFLGHVHKPQAVTKTIHYVGSPFQQNFGESGEAKRVAIFDSATLETKWVSLEDYGFPVYRTVGVKEYVKTVKEDSEDRYRVVVKSKAETDLLFENPLSTRAFTEYDYESEAGSAESVDTAAWGFEAVLTRWMLKHPPSESGIELSKKAMLDIGVQITTKT